MRGVTKTRYATRMDVVRPSAIRDLLEHAADPDIISFGGGYPDPALFPTAQLREIYEGILGGEDRSPMQYTVTDGLPSGYIVSVSGAKTRSTPVRAQTSRSASNVRG